MIIRNAVEADFKELKAFYVRMNEVINTRTEKFNPDNEVFPSDLMIRNAIADNGQFVGIEDDKIVAAIIVNNECAEAYHDARWQIEASKEEFWVLHALRILPEYEGRGFAKQMLKHIMEIAPDRGIRSLRIDVLEGYEVVGMYKGLGFELIDTVKIFYEDIGYPTDFWLLEKVI